MVLDWLFVQGYDTNAFRCNLYDREALRNWGVGWERRVALFLQKITRWMGYLCLFFGKNCWNLNKESRVTIKELEVGKDWWLCFSPSHFFLPQIPSFNIYQLTRFPQKMYPSLSFQRIQLIWWKIIMIENPALPVSQQVFCMAICCDNKMTEQGFSNDRRSIINIFFLCWEPFTKDTWSNRNTDILTSKAGALVVPLLTFTVLAIN